MKILLASLLVTLTGCAAWTSVRPVDYSDRSQTGLRVYDPIPLLVVTETSTRVVFVPNFERGYTVSFHAWLAKNQASIKVGDGALTTEMGTNMDTSGLLSLLQSVGGSALENADKLAAFGATVEGTISKLEGIYRFEFSAEGDFLGLRPIKMLPKS